MAAWLTTAQTAAVTLNDMKLKKLSEDGNKRAAALAKLISNASRFSETVDTARLFCAFFYMLTATMWLMWDVLSWFGGCSPTLGAVFSVLIIGLLAGSVYLIFGQLFPKRFGGYYSDKLALKTTNFLKVFIFIFTPVCALGRLLAGLFARLCGVVERESAEQVTEEEIRLLVDVGQEKGVIEESEKTMINNIFEFGDRVVSEVMTHRTELCAVERHDSIAEVLRETVEGGHSKLPVYEEDLDTIVGMLYVKDMLPFVGREIPEGADAGSIMRPPFFVPESIKLAELFEEMTARHLTMAVVVDEYGGTSGVVTLEDLLESIVGNMRDEYDHEDEEIVRRADGSFEVDGSLQLSELEELLDITFPEGDYDTVGGLLLSELGRIPAEGQNTELTIGGVRFVIVEVQSRRIVKVLVEKIKEEVSEGDPTSQKE